MTQSKIFKNSSKKFRNTGFFKHQWADVNFGTRRDTIQLELGRMKDLIHGFDLGHPQPKWSKFPKPWNRNLYKLLHLSDSHEIFTKDWSQTELDVVQIWIWSGPILWRNGTLKIGKKRNSNLFLG